MNNNKVIAKNTLYLYMRTAITMLIALYTSRVILMELGIDDYGIYNVIGGIVALLSSLSSTLSGATQRFITFALGTKSQDYLKTIFSASVYVHIALALVLLIIAETVGLWFVNVKMNIAIDRVFAANIVFQSSIFVFIMDIITLPYNSATIAYEKFNVYAFIFIYQSVARLLLVSTLGLWDCDRLIIYAAMELFVGISTKISFVFYTKLKLRDCRLGHVDDRSIYRKLFSFIGWNFLGTSSSIVYTQGSNVLLNLFYGVRLNAAMGVATQVQSAISSFVSNFSMAVNPQITKTYASGDIERTKDLMNFGSKIAAFLYLLIAFPVILNLDYIMNVWLVEIPDYTIGFIKIALLCSLFASFISPLNCALFATGKIKNYQIVCICVNALTFAILYLSFKFDMHPNVIYYLVLMQNILKIGYLLFYLHRFSLINLRQLALIYMKSIIFCIIIVFFLIIKSNFFSNTNFIAFIRDSFVAIVVMITLIYQIGFTNTERNALKIMIKNKIHTLLSGKNSGRLL